MDTKRVLRATFLQLAEKDDLTLNLLHGNIIVFDAIEVLLHLVQLVVVSSKERAGLGLGLLVQVFDDSPRNGDAVVGGGATTQLVEEHQRSWRHIIQYVRGFRHLDHECRLA